jgi:hypothetical protein
MDFYICDCCQCEQRSAIPLKIVRLDWGGEPTTQANLDGKSEDLALGAWNCGIGISGDADRGACSFAPRTKRG